MTAEETYKKEDKTKSEGSGRMGSGMLDMMEKCCSGEGAFSDCKTMMKGMIKTMRNNSFCEKREAKNETTEGTE